MVDTGNPYRGMKKPKFRRVPLEIEAKAAGMLIAEDSIHQVRNSTGLSKPYITKMREKLKAEGKIKA